MMLVPHQQAERKGSGANPGPLAKSVRKGGEGGKEAEQQKRDKGKLSCFFLGYPSPKSL